VKKQKNMREVVSVAQKLSSSDELGGKYTMSTVRLQPYNFKVITGHM